MNVSDMLEKKGAGVVTIGPHATVAEAAELLSGKRIGAVVVSEDGAGVAGILSERDIVRGLAERGEGLMTVRVAEIMTRDVVTCAPGDTGRELMAVMTERRLRHLPVVKDGRMCGLISIGDAVKHRLDEIVRESEELRSYISGQA